MDWFVNFVLWMVEPTHMIVFAWLCGAGSGWIIGRTRSTRKFEIERDSAKRDLDAVLKTFELKRHLLRKR